MHTWDNVYHRHCFGILRNALHIDCRLKMDGVTTITVPIHLKESAIDIAMRYAKEAKEAEKTLDSHVRTWKKYLSNKEKRKQKHYFDGFYYHHRYGKGNNSTLRFYAMCESWFQDNYEFFRDMFLHFSGYKTLEFAIKSTETFMDLWGQMEEWMMNRWRIWMKKMEVEIQKKTGVAVPRVPSSHGGVANLLKILTRTMEKQGADIRSIAKVQYAVCVQAGVMIPEVFLTDVASALDYKEAMENIDG